MINVSPSNDQKMYQNFGFIRFEDRAIIGQSIAIRITLVCIGHILVMNSLLIMYTIKCYGIYSTHIFKTWFIVIWFFIHEGLY